MNTRLLGVVQGMVNRLPVYTEFSCDIVNLNVTFKVNVVTRSLLFDKFAFSSIFHWTIRDMMSLSDLQRLEVTSRILEEL
jgi:hypothetical protein